MNENYVGKTCPYCQYPIKQKSKAVFCKSCNIPHHRECWEENRVCTTFGCKEISYKEFIHDKLEVSLHEPINQQNSISRGGGNRFIISAIAVPVFFVIVFVVIISLVFLSDLLSTTSQQSTVQTDPQPTQSSDPQTSQNNAQAIQETDTQETQEAEEIYYVVTEQGTNLFIRKSPGSDNKRDSDIITRVPRGTRLEVINNHGNSVRKDGFTWWEIRVLDSGVSGWVASEFISTSRQASPQAIQVEEDIYYVITERGSNLFIRKSPGTENKRDSDIITRVPRGTRLKVINNHSNSVRRDGFTWWEIRVLDSGVSGWVASEYISTNANAVYR